MAVSLEARNPLLDPAVVAVALRSTVYAEEGPGRKPLLRDALRLVLPDELVDRPKMGFTVPHTAWLRGELKDLLHDLVLSGPDELYRRSTARSVNRAPRRRQPPRRATSCGACWSSSSGATTGCADARYPHWRRDERLHR